MKKNYEIKNNELTLKINKNIYPKEVVIQTTYVLLDKYYFLIDEDKSNWLLFVKLKDLESEENLEDIALKIFDELIESSSYLNQLQKTSKIRQVLLEKALITQNTKIDQNK